MPYTYQVSKKNLQMLQIFTLLRLTISGNKKDTRKLFGYRPTILGQTLQTLF